MATSLMIDSLHSHNIHESLINAAEILMDSTYSGENDQSLAIDEGDELNRRREEFLAKLKEEDDKIYTRAGHIPHTD